MKLRSLFCLVVLYICFYLFVRSVFVFIRSCACSSVRVLPSSVCSFVVRSVRLLFGLFVCCSVCSCVVRFVRCFLFVLFVRSCVRLFARSFVRYFQFNQS
jgi:hypothetical protein